MFNNLLVLRCQWILYIISYSAYDVKMFSRIYNVLHWDVFVQTTVGIFQGTLVKLMPYQSSTTQALAGNEGKGEPGSCPNLAGISHTHTLTKKFDSAEVTSGLPVPHCSLPHTVLLLQ